VRGEHAGEGAIGDDQLDTVPGDAGVVGVLGRAVVAAVLDDLGSDRTSHPGPQAVGSHDELGVDLHWGTAAVTSVHAGGPAGIVQVDAADRDAEPHVGARGGGRLGHQGVEEVAPRRDEQVHAGFVLDRPGRRVVVHGEGDVPDGRCPAVQHGLEQPPTVQLHDAGAGDLMRRDRVCREDRPVGEDDVVSETGEQQRGGGTGGTCTNDDNVVAMTVDGHDESDSRSVDPGLARRSGGLGSGEPRSPAADQTVVEKVHNGLLSKPVPAA